jgi:transposase
MLIRTVKGSNADYLYLVEGYREGGKVKQRTIASFGKINELCPIQLKEMAMKLLALCPSNTLIDLEHTDELHRKNWAAPKITDKLWEKFKLNDFFKKTFANRDIKYDIEKIIKLMLVDRLVSPRSKLKAYENQENYDSVSDIELHNIYKSLNELSDLKPQIEKHLFEQNKLQDYINLTAVFFDVTTFHFESVKQDELKNFGYSKNAKFNEVQVVLSLLITEDGIPLGYDLFSGNTYEGNTLNSSIKKLKDEYAIKKVIVVADRGINSGENLHSLVSDGFEYIVGNRFKNLPKNIQKKILANEDYIEIKKDKHDQDIFKYKIFPYEKKIKIGEKAEVLSSNLVCTYSAKRAKKDQADRERLISKAENIIKKGDSSKSRGAKKYLIEDQKSSFTLNIEKIEEDAKWDGYYAIETSDAELSADKALDAYHQLWKIEDSFKVYKSHLETRPLYHWTPDRIKGHFVLSYIAFLFERILEVELKKIGEDEISPSKIRNALNMMEYSELNCGNKHYKLFSKINHIGSKILESVNITPPKKAIPA